MSEKCRLLLTLPVIILAFTIILLQNQEENLSSPQKNISDLEGQISIHLSSEPNLIITDSLSPPFDHALPFGSVTTGSSSEQTITLSNRGVEVLSFSKIAQVDPLNSPFEVVWNQCKDSGLEAFERCVIRIRFSPTTSEFSQDQLLITSKNSKHPAIQFILSGRGRSAQVPNITISDTAGLINDLKLGFGTITAGRIAKHTIRLRNDGNKQLIIGALASENPIQTPFSLRDDACSGRVLAIGGTCDVRIAFEPILAASQSEQFDIPSNDPDGPIVITLSGKGLKPVANNAPSQPELLSPRDGREGEAELLQFAWHLVDDPDGDFVDYELFLCEDPVPFKCAATVKNTEVTQNFIPLFFGVGFILFSLGAKFTKNSKMLILLCFAVSVSFISCGSENGGVETGEPGIRVQVLDKLSPNTKYYWGVVAKDEKGGRTRSEVWSFSTQ